MPDAPALRECPACSRRFRDVNSLWQHHKAKHHGKEARDARMAMREEIDAAREKSVGEMLVEAQMTGEWPDWLASMFPDEHAQSMRDFKAA